VTAVPGCGPGPVVTYQEKVLLPETMTASQRVRMACSGEEAVSMLICAGRRRLVMSRDIC
jgi:hypothetical protein